MPYRTAMAAEPETSATITEDDTPTEAELFLDQNAAKVLAAEAMARLRRPENTAEQTKILPPEPTAAPTTTQTAEEKRHHEMWAIVMVKEAGEITASIAGLPPAERKAASIRAAALSSTANQLLTGVSSYAPLSGAPKWSNPTASRNDCP